MHAWDLKTQMLKAIDDNGGWANCHAHFDKAYYISREGLDKSMVDMEEKWRMSDDIKRKSTPDEVEQRIRIALDALIAQKAWGTMTFVDAYDAVGTKNIKAALKVRQEYQGKINVFLASQPLGGLVDPAARKLYEEITAKCDYAGGLPSYDRPNDAKNIDYLFSIAKNLNKPIHVHVDQENNPNERDMEKIIAATKKYGYQGRVAAVHVISVSAQPKDYRTRIYKNMADLGIAAVVCPSAALGMRQLDQYQAPVHNSIANVAEMLAAGITVALGVDNVSDYYQPFIDGDMWIELRMLQEACRFYDFDQLVQIATGNGKKVLELT